MKEILLSHKVPAPELPVLGARLPNIINAPFDADLILSDVKLAVVGCGAIGRSVALHFARLNVRKLWLIDRKKIKKESLLTHAVVPQEISMPKATSLGRLIKTISPGTRVFAHDGPAEMMDLTSIKDADFVILATDNLNAEIMVGQLCLWLRIPLIQAAVHGDTLVSQVRFFGIGQQSACPACGYSRTEWNALNRQTNYSCEAGVRGGMKTKISGPPTMSVSFLCSLAADLCLAQFLRHTLQLGSAVDNTILEFCMYTHKTAVSPLKRNPNCPCDHTDYTRVCTLGRISEFSLTEIAGIAGYAGESDLNGISFMLGNMQYCEQGFCKCRQNRYLKRFFPPGKWLGRCSSCNENIYHHPFSTFNHVPATLVADQMNCRLGELGIEAEKWIMLRGDARSFLLISP